MDFNTGATFVPGGEDSYYMPEVIAPAPQRIAEQPTNMQLNVASMEQQAQSRPAQHQDVSPLYPSNSSWNHAQTNSLYSPNVATNESRNYTNTMSPPPAVYNQPQYSTGLSERPNFSPFPALRNPGPNIPPTDEQKEARLEQARECVLACNDPDIQITWAQDALAYVEVAIENEVRVCRTQPARPRTPRIEHVLREDSMKVINFLADQNHPKAEFIRGLWYEFGKFGHRLDKPESFECYKRAAERGYSRAWYRMGMQFENGNDPLTAVKYYRMAADAGDSAGCYRLGMMTLLGQHGQVQDYEQGLQLIYAAAHTADENAPQGAYVLGMLQAGELPQIQIPLQFLSQKVALAKTNIERAAFLGFAKAQVRMGAAYELGKLNCDFDPALSLHYNGLAARQGEVEAEMAISKWFLCGHEGVFDKNEELAFTYAQRAAIDGMATAQFAMGYFYEVGIYAQIDLTKAKDWYHKADESGNPDAHKRIDAVSRSKTISRKEHESVALQKIRQQHGAQNQAHSMPSISEANHPPISPTIDMPDPARLTLNATPVPPRSTSTAPYPVDPILPNTGGIPDFRPTSAFGINPNLQRAASAVPMSGPNLRPDSALHYNSMLPQHQPPAGYSMAQTGAPYGRGGRIPAGSPPGRASPANQQRPAPGRSPNSTSPRPNQSPLPPVPPQSRLGQSMSPQPEIGFTAPPDTSGADRPNWTPIPSGAGEGPRHSIKKDQHPPRTSSGQPLPSQQGGRPNIPNGYQSKPNRVPVPQSSQPRPLVPSKQEFKPAHITPSQPGPAPASAPNKLSDPPRQPHPAQVSANKARKDGTGPKTFEEMGIAKAQKESDCIVM